MGPSARGPEMVCVSVDVALLAGRGAAIANLY